MCGIAGFINLRGGCADPEQASVMIGALRHRGPDETGVFARDSVALAHARLSIIDLASGQQPMSIDEGRLWITFNGEIFNYIELREQLIQKGHRFATQSDTEVILHLYQEEGENCVRWLNGQWAFAIWDEKKKKLFLSRDRVGVRPLFYTQAGGQFLFASEIKALLACDKVERELDLAALDQIFTFWVTLPPRTAFKNVSQLPPGHSLTLENGQVRIHRYWNLEYAPDAEARNEDELTDELLSLLRDATRLRLRSDVPVGAYLSGGLDSTAITALTKSLVGDRLKTFSISFDDPEFDEGEYQREASRFLHTQHSEVRCDYQAIGRIFPDVIRHTEQPILRTAPAPMFLLAKLVREHGFKVVLTGEGADEMLGGYDIFKETKIRQFWGRNLSSHWRPLLLKRLYPYMTGIQRQSSAYLKKFFHVTEEDLSHPLFSHLPRWELTARLKGLFSEATCAELRNENVWQEIEGYLPAGYGAWSTFSRAEYLEATYLLPGYILSSQGDRMAMAHSVEGRYPFLDFRLVEFAAKLPSRLKMKVLNEKYLLKRAVGDMIPPSVLQRHKQPYRAPDGKSFFHAVHGYVDELLSPERIRQDGVFNATAVDALVKKFKTGHASSVKDNMALVGVLSTQLLIEQFIHRAVDNHCAERGTQCQSQPNCAISS